MKYLIEEQAIKAIIAYLKERPYKEVADAIVMLSALKKHEEKVEKKK